MDAAYAPFLRRYAFVETRLGCGLLNEFPAGAGVVGCAGRGRAGHRLGLADTFEHEFVVALHRRGAMAAPRFGPVSDAAD